MDDKQVDFELESIEEDEDRFIFTARSITNDFTCENGKERLAADSKGKHLIWRHEHPIIPKLKQSTHIMGRVLESKTDEKGILSRYEVYGHTEEHRKVREDIKKRKELGEPLSISMRFRTYGDEDNPVHMDVMEHSLTPTPACKECKIIDILNEDTNMEDKEKLMKEIKELEDELTKKDKILEDLETKVTTLEDDMKVKDTELEEAQESKDKVLKKLTEFTDKLNEQKAMIDKLNEDLAFKDIEPLVNKLVKLDGPLGEKMKPLYLQRAKQEGAVEFFKEAILEKESAPKPETKDLDQTANESFSDDELEDDKTKAERDTKAFAQMPAEFYKWKRGEK